MAHLDELFVHELDTTQAGGLEKPNKRLDEQVKRDLGSLLNPPARRNAKGRARAWFSVLVRCFMPFLSTMFRYCGWLLKNRDTKLVLDGSIEVGYVMRFSRLALLRQPIFKNLSHSWSPMQRASLLSARSLHQLPVPVMAPWRGAPVPHGPCSPVSFFPRLWPVQLFHCR
jgi:hypothetical protein